MKEGNAIEVRNITKAFKVYLDRSNNVKDFIIHRNRRRYENRQVLKGISFEIKKGEAVGLIGHNGCGKSTTLKLLTKIMYPDSGTIEMRGRVSSLIELGAGFHPDMSGRENIYINASIFGLSKKEIDNRIDDIIAFSELEDFIDNPVRTYSSGMYMRLAFSVAINVDAEILLIDEILAVGDTNFQAKCFSKLREIKANGATIVIVSHSLGQIEQICERSIWIHDGIIKEEGEPRMVHPSYLDYMGKIREKIAEKEAVRQELKKKEKIEVKDFEASDVEDKFEEQGQDEEESNKNEEKVVVEKSRWGNGKAKITSVTIMDVNRKEKCSFRSGEDILIKYEYEVKKPVKDVIFGVGIFRNDGIDCYGTNTRLDKLQSFDLTQSGQIEILLKNVNLLDGIYTLDFAIESDMGIAVDFWKRAKEIEIYSITDEVGIVRFEHEWKL